MANILDYLNWRGDLTFEESPLNEVDGLILSNLSYVSFDSIVASPWEEEAISLRQASRIFWRERDEKELLKEFSLIKMTPFAMRRVAASKRFGDLQLMYYQNSVDPEKESQFSALCIRISRGEYYIAFRGTDNTMIGWKENFRMCFETVPAQKKAVDYLNYVGRKCQGQLWLGGHSKGGNLAIYAAAKARAEVRSRIIAVQNYDGPGFSKTMLNSAGYREIRSRIQKYVPASSVVGMLLEHDGNCTIVCSHVQGLQQHDPLTWRVFGTRFSSVPKRGEESQMMDQTLHDWIYSLSLDERRTFVNMLFRLMEETNIHTMNDFAGSRWRRKLWQIQRKIRADSGYRQVMKNAGHQMMEEFSKSLTHMRQMHHIRRKG